MTQRHGALHPVPRRAAIYVRISEDREGRAAGVERQEQDCRALAGRRGLIVVGVYSDNDISASTRSKKLRPQYRQMFADAKAGHFDVIIAYTSGRLTRRPREHEDLIELSAQTGITYEYVNSPSFDLNTSAGRRVARILAATDAGEAEDIKERVQRQKLQAAQDGEWRGGRRPFGYEDDGVTIRQATYDENGLVIHHDEAAEVLRCSRELVAGTSLRSQVADLNARGITTSTGTKWTTTAWGRVLKRPRNAGLMEQDGEVTGKANWPAIVPEPTWRRVSMILNDPGRLNHISNVVRWMGSGLYLCHCGATVRAHGSGMKRPGGHVSYTCTVTKHLGRIASEVDKFVGEVVIERLSRDDAVDLIAEDTGENPKEAMDQADVVRGRLDELAELYATGALTASQLATASSLLRRQLSELEIRIAAAGRTSVLLGLVGEADVAAAWHNLGLDRKRAVISRLFTVELLAANKGRPKGWKPGRSYFDPATVRIRQVVRRR